MLFLRFNQTKIGLKGGSLLGFATSSASRFNQTKIGLKVIRVLDKDGRVEDLIRLK